MLVTINTDASYHSKYKVGAYAFYIVSDMGRYMSAGALKQLCNKAEKAEFMALMNAIHTLGSLGYTNIHKVIVNTDCLNVIHLCNHDREAIAKYKLHWGADLYRRYVLLLAKHNLTGKIEFRHLKSHVSTETKRQWVNDWCDKKAKEMLWNKINSK